MQTLAQLVTDVQATPASVAATAAALCERLPSVAGREAWGASKHVAQFFEASTRVLLAWSASGRDDDVRNLVAELQDVLSRVRPDPWEQMSPADQLAINLRHLLGMGETYLKTDNLALSLGKLLGQRRRAWRMALHLADGVGGLLTVRTLVDSGVFAQRNTADHSLNEMAKLGVLERHQQEYGVVFRLTFAGRQLCRELRRLQVDSETEVERARGGWQREAVTAEPARRRVVRERQQRRASKALAGAVLGVATGVGAAQR